MLIIEYLFFVFTFFNHDNRFLCVIFIAFKIYKFPWAGYERKSKYLGGVLCSLGGVCSLLGWGILSIWVGYDVSLGWVLVKYHILH